MRAVLLSIALLLLCCAACTLVEDGEPAVPLTARHELHLHIQPPNPSVHTSAAVTFSALDGEGRPVNVNWSIAEGSNGGTIDAFGIYRAPPRPGTYEVIATASADPTQKATARVQVAELAVVVQPAVAEASQGGTVQFAAQIAVGEVTWSAAAGTITDDGLFTAPHQAGPVTVTATSTLDPARSASATVLVDDVRITLDPWTITVDQGEVVPITASIAGTTDPRLRWSASGGTVDGNGLYTAPFAAGAYEVLATSAANEAEIAAASVTVRQVTVDVTPSFAEMTPGGTLRLTASLHGTADPAVTWSASGGQISADGRFVAPLVPGQVTITATSTRDPSGVASSIVVVADVPAQTLDYTDPDDAAPWRLVRNEEASSGPLIVLDLVGPPSATGATLELALDPRARWVEPPPNVDPTAERHAEVVDDRLYLSVDGEDDGALGSIAIELSVHLPAGTTIDLDVERALERDTAGEEFPVEVNVGRLVVRRQ